MTNRIFILGTSGSLTHENLSLLHGERVFGLNSLPLHCPEIITDYVALDMTYGLIPEVRDQLPLTARRHFPHQLWNCMPDEYTEQTNIFSLAHPSVPGFSFNPHKLYQGKTVAYIALQLAAQSYPDEIYLLGIDLDPIQGHIPEHSLINTYLAAHRLRDPGYDKRLENNQSYINRFPAMLKAFNQAKHTCLSRNITIYNCSSASKLTMFDYIPLSQLINKEDSCLAPVAQHS